MTSKDLSRELCEICGIEPKCINCGQTVSDENPCPKPCDKQKYPDFTRPENFVRILELAFTTPKGYILTTVEALQNEGFLIFKGRKLFLEQLLNYISMNAKFSKYIKLAIKSEVWLYD